MLTSFKDLVFGILKKLCKSNGGERGWWSPIALEKEGVPISRQENKDYENVIRKMKEWNISRERDKKEVDENQIKVKKRLIHCVFHIILYLVNTTFVKRMNL